MRDRESAKPVASTSAAVADYLRRHPEFLVDHPDLLDILTPPAQRRGDGTTPAAGETDQPVVAGRQRLPG